MINGNREFEHKELTYQIIAAAFEVHKTLGYGFLERYMKKRFCMNCDQEDLELKRKWQ